MNKEAVWWGNLVGSTVAQSSFYTEAFDKILEDKYVYASEITGWSARAMSKWFTRLVKMGVLERHREGWGGKIKFTLGLEFFMHLKKMWKRRKDAM